MFNTESGLLPLIRNNQPIINPCGEIFMFDQEGPGLLYTKRNPFTKENIYEVRTNDEIEGWLRETFPGDTRIVQQRTLKGVWTDMPEDVYMLLKLKFA